MIGALVWSERLLGLALVFQSLEYLRLKSVWDDEGVWRWSDVRKSYQSLSPILRDTLDLFLSQKNFEILLKLRLCLSILIWMIHPGIIVGILFFSTWLIALRWRGMFNGGSDSMTALIALSLFVAQVFSNHEWVIKACLAYIAVQLTASYFLAGYAKLKNREWRTGTALALFFETPRYDSPPATVKKLANDERYAKWISFMLIAFECSFPLAWLNAQVCIVYLILGFLFHLANFYVFGLNRFVFAWLAAYPALYYWSGSFSK